MNKVVMDKAAEQEAENIRNYMKTAIDQIYKEDKSFIFYHDNEINLVRDVNSDFFLTRVCSGMATGYEGWHRVGYLIYLNGTMKLKWIRHDAYGPYPYPSDEELASFNREDAALYLYYGNICAWRKEEKRSIASCSFVSD